jgi:hypothetical protein
MPIAWGISAMALTLVWLGLPIAVPFGLQLSVLQ